MNTSRQLNVFGYYSNPFSVNDTDLSLLTNPPKMPHQLPEKLDPYTISIYEIRVEDYTLIHQF